MQNDKTKNKIITTLIAFAVVCSALAGYLIYHYMSPQRGTIYMFNNSYSAGTQITSDMLTPLQVDANIIVAGRKDSVSSRFVTPSEYADIVRSGDSLRMDVSEGMPLVTTMLSVSGGSTVEMNMKSDAIAVTIPVDQFTGVTNDLKEGARVNVYAVSNSVTVLIQQNKRVLEVFKNGGSIIGVSLEEDIQESMELIMAESSGNIYLGLVDATGYQSSEGTDPYYVSDISKYLSSNTDSYQDDYYAYYNYSIPQPDSSIQTEEAVEDKKQSEEETEVDGEPSSEEDQDSNDGQDAVFVP